MRIVVKLHAGAVDLAGATEANVDVEPGATCRDVKQALAERHPSLRGLLGSSVLATDAEYLADSAPVSADALHFIPPVSGG